MVEGTVGQPSSTAERRPPTLAECAVDRNNNFNLIRATLAFMVLVHHGLVLTGNRVDPTNLITRFIAGFGEIAVGGFFIVSGFLVTRSLFGRATVARFGLARVLRIYPGLIVMLLVTTALLAPFSTLAASDYFASIETWRYVAQNATAFFITFDLPGLFRDNLQPAVNGSLWSLRYEILCYMALALAGALGLARKRWPIVLACVACATALLTLPDTIHYILHVGRRMGFLFSLGAVAAAYSAAIPMRFRYLAALAAVALVLDWTPLSFIGWSIAFAYLLLWFAYVPKGAILNYNRLPDISYGLYIYAFPVQQLAIHLGGYGADPLGNILIATPVTILLATLSWYLVEKPGLDLKNWISLRKDPRAESPLPARVSETP